MSDPTPGPWIVERTPDHLWVGYPKAYAHKVSEVVCYFEVGDNFTDDSNDLRLANARLIAAAPALLWALKAMILNDAHAYRDCHKAAVAAVAKAEANPT